MSKEELIEEIKFMKHSSIEEFTSILLPSLLNYIKSIYIFGFSSNVTKENIVIIKEFYLILRKERILLNKILNSINYIDINEAFNIIEKLDELNEKTYTYYSDIINEIEIACNLNNENRTLKSNKVFPTLINDDSYENEILNLIKH